ncbi:hypothetical protein CUMW_269210 [Citrus unshiu]|uniref:Disease resistance protein winged helix domain-containing protein n=1 Tax=Citrus unshiu TaxID=55188 RepID=A0A2H5QXP6_CITUN|nr:hypothetical protein CUMW_269210 [Citrus unshiu]
MEKKVLSRLKFSYDSLPNDELRSCLLYCYLFPEDSKIPKIDLIDYWESEGFLDSIGGWDVLGALVRACLLEDGGDHVKMHDMIHDMALWIANEIEEEEEEKFLVRAGVGLTDAPKIEEWEGVKRISLMQNKIRSLPQIPTCPRLQTLLLEYNHIEEITESFFQSLPSLRVLSLKRNYSLTELPVGILSLVSLHHLDLSRTCISGLPQELKALVLRMLYCGPRHQPIVEEGNVLSADAESLMKEIHCLEQLNLITLSFRGSRGVENFLKFPKLQNITQALYIEDCNSLPLNLLHLANMEHLEELDIEDKMMGEFNLFVKLELLIIRNASNLERIYRDPLPFPQLEEIRISECPKLKKLPLNSSSAKGHNIVIAEQKEWWEELQWEDQATQNAFFPCFRPIEE